MTFSETYTQILSSLNLSAYATPALAEKFELLYTRLVEFNSHTNLTAITDAEGVITRHFADSLTAAPLLGSTSGLSVIDVGCGGGFPTLPLAIVRPDLRFTALDSTAKKLKFVEQTASELNLPVQTLAARAEEVASPKAAPSSSLRESFDLCLSRAVARLPILAELTLPFVKVGGRLIALKGADGETELAEAKTAIEKLGGSVKAVHPLTLGSAGDRMLIEIEKIAPTPTAFPRTFGQIKKKPL